VPVCFLSDLAAKRISEQRNRDLSKICGRAVISHEVEYPLKARGLYNACSQILDTNPISNELMSAGED